MSRFTCDLRPVHRFAIHAGVAFSMMLGATLSHADTQTLTAGSPPSSAPTTFMDVKTQNIEGPMPDVVNETGRREGFNVSFAGVPLSRPIRPAVRAKIANILAASTPH